MAEIIYIGDDSAKLPDGTTFFNPTDDKVRRFVKCSIKYIENWKCDGVCYVDITDYEPGKALEPFWLRVDSSFSAFSTYEEAYAEHLKMKEQRDKLWAELDRRIKGRI